MNKLGFLKIMLLGLSMLFSFSQVSMAGHCGNEKAEHQKTHKASGSSKKQAVAIEDVEGESDVVSKSEQAMKKAAAMKTQSNAISPGSDVSSDPGRKLADPTRPDRPSPEAGVAQ